MLPEKILIEKWKEQAEKGKIPYNLFFEVLIDIREILNIKEEENKIGCIKCGLKKKYWSKMFCGDGGDHKK